VERITAQAVSALGLLEGPIHTELRVTAGQPRIIEVAARSIGGICGRALQFGLLGTSLETLILRHFLGRSVHRPNIERGASGVMMIPIPGAGTLTEVRGVDLAEAVPGIRSVDITAARGSYLRPVPDADQYLGFIFATAAAPSDVVTMLEEAHARLEIDLS
ncbi:MAG TPA: biotin carboxylase, partial [Acidimicrobiia bacterium]|nr:biotin carboxylase [Acidimicrobiia bacterium]